MPPEIEEAQKGTSAEQISFIKTLRAKSPRKSHRQWKPAYDRPDPIGLLQAQDKERIEQLLPIKYGRMLASPFAFLRGSAVVMAADLAQTPVTGLEAVICGDAHLSNFGIFATPERSMVFDINDFDEAYFGPWEWDLKRLVASAVVAGRENGFSDKQCRDLVIDLIRVYAYAMDKFSQAHVLDVWYYHINVDSVLKVFEKASKQGEKSAQKMVRKAGRKTHQQTLEKLTSIENGKRRIINDPPLLVPFRELGLERYLVLEALRQPSEDVIRDAWSQYLASLPDERRYLLNQFQITDAALRVGGVGSVGTRCIIVLLESQIEEDALILQLKEAGPSVLEAYVDRPVSVTSAQRVVTAQRLMQATSDIFLGWHTSQFSNRDYYWRQLKDMKGSANVAGMDYEIFKSYLGVCAWCLARAHARTGDEASIAGYIGKNDDFAQALADFALAYADQTESDFQDLVAAVKSGRIAAETGI